MLKRGFLTFWIFLLFFRNFLARVEYERNSGLKFFSNFFGFSHPILVKTNAEKRFYKFFEFFYYFFGIFLPWSSINKFRNWNFSFSFSAYLIPFWVKIMLERGFYIFLIFLLFFSQFSSLAKFERNSGLKVFFPFFVLSHPILAKNNAEKRFFFNFLNYFAIV